MAALVIMEKQAPAILTEIGAPARETDRVLRNETTRRRKGDEQKETKETKKALNWRDGEEFAKGLALTPARSQRERESVTYF
jgi:hypothetical protein